MREILRGCDLDPNCLARLEHRASERVEQAPFTGASSAQRASLDLVPFVTHDLGQRLVDADVP